MYDGRYMVTKKVLESASETDDEDEDIPKAEAAKEEKNDEPAQRKKGVAVRRRPSRRRPGRRSRAGFKEEACVHFFC